MCYNSCKHFWYNPLDGTDGCKRPYGVSCTLEICGEFGEKMDYCVCEEEMDYYDDPRNLYVHGYKCICQDTGVRFDASFGGWRRCECEKGGDNEQTIKGN